MPKLKDRAKLLPIRRGLIEANHYRKMGETIWLFQFLISIVSWKTWEGETSYKVIEKRFGISETTVWRWLKKLRKSGYLECRRSKYSFIFKIKPPRSQDMFKQINEFVENFGRQTLHK